MDDQPKRNIDELILGGNPIPYTGSKEARISPSIKIIYSRIEYMDKWNIHIIIDQNTTKRDFIDAWTKIRPANKWLHSLQAPHVFSLSFLLTQFMVTSKIKMSYARLAEEINLFAIAYLFMASRKHLTNDIPGGIAQGEL